MPRESNRKQSGDLVPEPRELNAMYNFWERMRTIKGVGLDINLGTLEAPIIARDHTPTMHAQLTGPYSDGYPWQEVTVGPNRTIATTGLTGSPTYGAPAFERRTGDTTLTADGTVYLMRRSPASAQWVFPHRTPPGSSSGGGNTLDGCPCTGIPNTLNLNSSAPLSNNQIFQNATLVYGSTPADLISVVIQANSYLSNAAFFDPIMGTAFYYFFTCVFGTYVLTRVYPTSPLGSPFRDSIRYSWLPGFPGNSCSPFLMANGQIFNGGNATCVVTVTV